MLNYKHAAVLIPALAALLLGQLLVNYAEAKTIYHMDSQHTLGVFLMISLTIAGIGIMLALYTRGTMALE